MLQKPLRAALTGTNASPGIFEVIWVVGRDETIRRLEGVAAGQFTIKEPPTPQPAPAHVEEKATTTPAAGAVAETAPFVPSGDLEAQAKETGDEIRALKAKLKADGMSGKKIDKTEEVVALVSKLNIIKAAIAAGSAKS
eukprot:gnl/TRDRNA2_/TRDRNA2_156861_c0_seq1.p2 gnl/TRDRNA2_/TRDRNA2_156861_c0~~gnl/TRDRNA2_/TRDRNA2_156861_c0_seq1.p2  ORF type:complete len:139 (+),score=35.71 gnl/TRDRNA2_/TRDRNA2_156861_c0_seq1:365-781(+)